MNHGKHPWARPYTLGHKLVDTACKDCGHLRRPAWELACNLFHKLSHIEDGEPSASKEGNELILDVKLSL